MYVSIVYVSVIPQHIDAFIEATNNNHLASINEEGNRRFDVLQASEDTTKFVLYEAYADEAAALAHKQTEHYQIWRDRVADWMAIPRKGIHYSGLFPA
ncbi:Antibiotic biosynthesis monooxygenase [hydrothermal vent metagenome]|uniref:Antibiotic biosynthesis monooxygenase n=1 Tax=hydrothermal vent metagenome TaxID=652676 RepID=A0A3B0ZIM7_9ZZZZ